MRLATMSDFQNNSFPLQSAVSTFECGERYAPNNELGIPFYFDIQPYVPTAYQVAREYLEVNTDIWHLWESEDQDVMSQLRQGKTSRSGAYCLFGAQVLSTRFSLNNLSCISFQ